MKKKQLSIIIPVYNVEEYISTLLNSIISFEKGLSNWLEIILVDDGSTDNSGNVCDQYASKYSFIKVIHQDNQGQSVARNVALDVAKGEWITFVDSDDLVRKDYLSILLSNIKSNKDTDIIIFNYKKFGADNIENMINRMSIYSKNKISILSKSTAMYYITTEEIGNYMWNKIFRKRLFDNVRFPVGRRYEDIAVLYRCFQLADKISLYDDCLYFYRQRLNSTVHAKNSTQKADLLREAIRARNEQLAFFKKYKYSHAFDNASRYLMIDEVFYIIIVNEYNLDKDHTYVEAKKYIRSHTPHLNEGKKVYLFVKLYNIFPRLIEKYLKNRKDNF